MDYTTIQSDFILSEIKKTNWDNREYINDLISLSNYTRNSPKGHAANIHFFSLKNQHPEAYIYLAKEISSERGEQASREVAEAKNCAATSEIESDNLIQGEKETWFKAGGK